MATKTDAWQSLSGDLFATETEADQADRNWNRLQLKTQAQKVIELASSYNDANVKVFKLSGLDHTNHDTLAPLIAYLVLLSDESKERTEKYGGK